MSYLRLHPRKGGEAVCRSFRATACPAVERYFRFHGFPADGIDREQHPGPIPRVLVHLGWLKALVYASDRGSPGRERTYIHFMETPPRLACDPKGTRLFLLGGRYRVTPRGIEG